MLDDVKSGRSMGVRLCGLLSVAVITHAATANAADISIGVPPNTAIVVADDANGMRDLLKVSGEQDKLAATVTYANFSSGPLRLETIRAGAAQVGAVGDVPPILADFSGANVVIVGAVFGKGVGSLITTAPKTDIRTLGDLKGKRLGINQGTAQQAILLRNLKAAGLGIKDIDPINLGLAEFADALRAGQIDAAVLKQPDRVRYLQTTAADGARELDSAPGTNPNISYLYASKVALEDPAQASAIRDLVIHWYRAYAWKNAHREAWISEYFVKDQKLKSDDAAAAYDSQGDVVSSQFTEGLVGIQQETIDVLQAAGSFPNKKLNARDEFDFRFGKLSAADKAARD